SSRPPRQERSSTAGAPPGGSKAPSPRSRPPRGGGGGGEGGVELLPLRLLPTRSIAGRHLTPSTTGAELHRRCPSRREPGAAAFARALHGGGEAPAAAHPPGESRRRAPPHAFNGGDGARPPSGSPLPRSPDGAAPSGRLARRAAVLAAPARASPAAAFTSLSASGSAAEKRGKRKENGGRERECRVRIKVVERLSGAHQGCREWQSTVGKEVSGRR
ncbi:unnamed protein product, partial [Urochloa humidicola]